MSRLLANECIPSQPGTFLIIDHGRGTEHHYTKEAVIAWRAVDDFIPLRPVIMLGAVAKSTGWVVLFPDGHVEGSAFLYWETLGDFKAYRERRHTEVNSAIVKEARQKAAKSNNAKLDDPVNVERARNMIRNLLRNLVAKGDVAIAGQGGNDRTYKLAAQLVGDLALPGTVINP